MINIFNLASFLDPNLSFAKDIFDEICKKDRILDLFWTILENVESKKMVQTFGVILASAINFPRGGYESTGGVENFHLELATMVVVLVRLAECCVGDKN